MSGFDLDKVCAEAREAVQRMAESTGADLQSELDRIEEVRGAFIALQALRESIAARSCEEVKDEERNR